MRKKISISKTIFMLLIFMMTILIGNENVFAETKVSNFDELKAALNGTDPEIKITSSDPIKATETLKINRDVKISGGGYYSL